MCDKYNGWANRQTWIVGLWIDNDHATYNRVVQEVEYLKERAPDASQVLAGIWTVEQYIKFKLADWIKEIITFGNPLADDASLYSDLLGYALAMVDWQEVASHYIEEG